MPTGLFVWIRKKLGLRRALLFRRGRLLMLLFLFAVLVFCRRFGLGLSFLVHVRSAWSGRRSVHLLFIRREGRTDKGQPDYDRKDCCENGFHLDFTPSL